MAKADEIRGWWGISGKDSPTPEQAQMTILREIAAQLAELNENIKSVLPLAHGTLAYICDSCNSIRETHEEPKHFTWCPHYKVKL